MLVLVGLVGLHSSTSASSVLTGLSVDLDYCDIEWFALEVNRDHFVIFEIASKYCFWTLFLTLMATPFLLRDSFPQ